MCIKDLLLIAVIAALSALSLSCGKASASMAPEIIESVDLDQVKDGTWLGAHDSVTVAVTVESHRITRIDYLKAGWSSVGRKAEYIRNVIIEKQSLEVDVISGATISSKDILKAVEIALEKGMV